MSVNDANTGEVKNNPTNSSAVVGGDVDTKQNDPEAHIPHDTSVYDGYANDEAMNISSRDSSELNFSSEDIAKRQKGKFFVRVAGAEKRARAEKRKKEKEARERIKEASKKQSNTETAKNKQDADRLRETKRVRSHQRLNAFSQAVKRAKFIIIGAIAAIALVIVAIIVVPIIAGNIQQAEKDDFIQKNKTGLQDIYMQIADGNYSVDELKAKVKELNSDAVIEAYELTGSGEIWIRDNIDRIKFSFVTENGKQMIDDCEYHDTIDGSDVYVYKSGDKYSYVSADKDDEYDSVKEAMEQYILDKNREGK